MDQGPHLRIPPGRGHLQLLGTHGWANAQPVNQREQRLRASVRSLWLQVRSTEAGSQALRGQSIELRDGAGGWPRMNTITLSWEDWRAVIAVLAWLP